MKKLLFILLLLPFIAKGTSFPWNISDGNILINRANFPTATAGDTITILPASGGGYRSFNIAGMSSGTPGVYITVWWSPGAIMTPNPSTGVTNSIDNSNDIKIEGMVMNNNANPVCQLGSTDYSHRIWWDHCSFKSGNGMGLNYSGTMHVFTYDTVNCYYKWRISFCNLDSAVGGHDGAVSIVMGRITTDGVWLSPEIDHDTMGDLSSATVASGFMQMYFCFGALVHDNIFRNLGLRGPNFAGHAAQIFSENCYIICYHNYFGTSNFGNCWRVFGSMGIPQMASLGYMGSDTSYGNIDDSSIKYSMHDYRADPSDSSILHFVPTELFIYNCVAFRLGVGVGHNSYNSSVLDFGANGTGTDSLHVFNCAMVGPPTDTICGATGVTGGVGWSNALITLYNGATRWDTASNKFVCTFAASGFKDSISFTPILNGLLYNAGITVPFKKDYFGNPIPTVGRPSFGLNHGVDIGAVQLLLSAACNCIVVPVGAKISIH